MRKLIKEQRLSRRLASVFEISAVFRQQLTEKSRTSNASVDGLFLQAKFPNTTRNDNIEIQIQMGTRCFFLQATVAHISNDGVGVMFTEPQPELYQRLLNYSSASHFLADNPYQCRI